MVREVAVVVCGIVVVGGIFVVCGIVVIVKIVVVVKKYFCGSGLVVQGAWLFRYKRTNR